MMKWMLIFAFLVQLANGQTIFIRDAIGFAIGDKENAQGEKVKCHVFFDAKQNLILAVPSEYIQGAIYIPEHQVM